MNKLSTLKEIQEFEAQGLMPLPQNTYSALQASAEKHANLSAMQFFLDGKSYQNAITITYSELLQKVNACANMFFHFGLSETDAVSVLLPNCPEFVFSLFGAQARGIINPINPMLELDHLKDIVNECQSKIIITLAPNPELPLIEKVKALVKLTPTVHTVLMVDLANYLDKKPSTDIQEIDGIKFMDFHHVLNQQNTEALDFECTKTQQSVASYFHTGGTTGSPKVAQHSHLNELSNAFIVQACLQSVGHKNFLCGLPWFHVNGVIVTGFVPLLNGHNLVLATPSGYRNVGLIQNFWKIVEHFQINFFSAVPTILSTLLNIPKGDANISSLENVICGAAPLSEKLFNDFQVATGVAVIEGYGFTEGTCANTVNPLKGVKKIGSVGLCMPFHQLKVVILDSSEQFVRQAEVNEQGIIVAFGPNVIKGYKNAQHNKNAFIEIDSQKWYNTGDLGKYDADGYLFLTGRKKELIIRGGHNIDPKMIEEPLSKHPAVAAVAAVARPDKYAGELPVAYVELKPNQSLSITELMDFAVNHIPEKAAIPKKIYILPSLPLTAVGKIFKPELENQQIKEVFEEALSNIPEIEKYEIHFDMRKGRVINIYLKGLDNKNCDKLVQDELGYYSLKYNLINQ